MGVKDNVRELEQNIANVVSEVWTKITEMKKKFAEPHDVSGMVAAEVHQHQCLQSAQIGGRPHEDATAHGREGHGDHDGRH